MNTSSSLEFCPEHLHLPISTMCPAAAILPSRRPVLAAARFHQPQKAKQLPRITQYRTDRHIPRHA
jgi:hypothetical protein